MEVLISKADDHLWLVVEPEHLTPVAAVWFNSYIAAEDYCIDHNYVICQWAEDDD